MKRKAKKLKASEPKWLIVSILVNEVEYKLPKSIKIKKGDRVLITMTKE